MADKDIIEAQAKRIAYLEDALRTLMGRSYHVITELNEEKLSVLAVQAQLSNNLQTRRYITGVLKKKRG